MEEYLICRCAQERVLLRLLVQLRVHQVDLHILGAGPEEVCAYFLTSRATR